MNAFACRKLKMVEVEIAKRELSEKRQLEATKLELHRELKRKIALETMLNTLNVSLIGHLLVLGLVMYWRGRVGIPHSNPC